MTRNQDQKVKGDFTNFMKICYVLLELKFQINIYLQLVEISPGTKPFAN